jgi:hypothetical protein
LIVKIAMNFLNTSVILFGWPWGAAASLLLISLVSGMLTAMFGVGLSESDCIDQTNGNAVSDSGAGISWCGRPRFVMLARVRATPGTLYEGGGSFANTH